MKIVAYTLLAMFFANALSAQEASQIIKLSAEKYAGMKVYMDSGKVVASFYNTTKPHSYALLFKTAYSEKGSFNFEYYTLGSTHLNILNRDAEKQVKIWKGLSNQIISEKPFNHAMASFLGSSSFSVALVPTLLMHEEKLIPKTIYNQISDPKILSTELVNGVECYKIAGSEVPIRGLWIVWISKSDLLIRKAENDRQAKDLKIKTTYSYFPHTTNTPGDFAFKPNRKVSL